MWDTTSENKLNDSLVVLHSHIIIIQPKDVLNQLSIKTNIIRLL